ncbi:creatininase family protein [Croceifilum oryzae]
MTDFFGVSLDYISGRTTNPSPIQHEISPFTHNHCLNHFSTWTDLQDMGLAFFPIGSLEQHGPHLPIGTDSFIAQSIASGLSKKFPNSFVVPTLPYSSSFEHIGFPGAISLRSTTIISVVQDVIHSLERMGIQKIVLVNGHGGNYLLGNIAQEMNVDKPYVFVTPNRHHWDRAYEKAELSISISRDMHAGEGETSILLHLIEEGIIPSSVKPDKYMDVDSPNRPLLQAIGMRPYTSTGAIGFPTRASSRKGKLLLQELINQISITVEEFLGDKH